MTPEKLSSLLGQIVFRLVIFCLVGFALFQTVLQLNKYASEQTTLAKTSRLEEVLLMPAISFCLGFDRDKAEMLPWMMWTKQGEDNFPATWEEAERQWEQVTLSTGQVQVQVSTRRPDEKIWHCQEHCYDIGNITSNVANKTEGCLSAEEHGTLSGKCYTLQWRCPMTQYHPDIRIHFFNLSSFSQSRLVLYLHDSREVLGLNENFWHGSVTAVELFVGEVTDVMIQKKVRKRQGTFSEEDYFSCMTEAHLQWGDSLNETSLCQVPSFESVLKGVSKVGVIPFCPSAKSYHASLTQAIYPLLQGLSSNCREPNEQAGYVTKQGSQVAILPRHQAIVNICLGSMEVIVEEEYILLDFGATISAVGGIMGMLLGWSAKDLARLIPSTLEKLAGFCFFSTRIDS